MERGDGEMGEVLRREKAGWVVQEERQTELFRESGHNRLDF